MSKKILEFHTHCKGCDTKIPVALMRGDKLNCPFCDKIKTTTNIEYIQRHLHKGAKDFYEQCYEAGIEL